MNGERLKGGMFSIFKLPRSSRVDVDLRAGARWNSLQEGCASILCKPKEDEALAELLQGRGATPH